MEGESWALYGDVYLVRGQERDGASTDAIIADIETGRCLTCPLASATAWMSVPSAAKIFGILANVSTYPGKEYDGQLCYNHSQTPL